MQCAGHTRKRHKTPQGVNNHLRTCHGVEHTPLIVIVVWRLRRLRGASGNKLPQPCAHPRCAQ
eukprot:1027018-Alexandrium_andersonii.AAC.1